MALGFDREFSHRVIGLLSRQEELNNYVNQGRAVDCYPVTRVSSAYPALLRKRLGEESPGCLWGKGDFSLLDTPAIALVGSRDLNPPNLQFAQEAGRQAALQGYTLISGNARGADRAAQDACLDAGGNVISVIADRLDQKAYRRHILYLSEDGFDAPFSTVRALRRNRVIHAFGRLTLAAQCTLGKGGTWSGAATNLRHSYSPLFCFQDGSEAVKMLLQMGAYGISLSELSDFSKLTGSR